MRQQTGQVLSARVVGDVARAIIDADKETRHILSKNGGRFNAGDTWCQEVLHELGFSKRRCTTAASKLPADWEHQGAKVTHQVIPPLLVTVSAWDICMIIRHISPLFVQHVTQYILHVCLSAL